MDNNFKCCKPLPKSKKCCSDTRNLSDGVIEKLKCFGCKIPLDSSLKICSRCRLQVYRLPSNKTPSNDGMQQDLEQPSTSGVRSTAPIDIESESMVNIIPSVTSLASSTSADSVVNRICLSHNIETFNQGIMGIHVSPITTKRLRSACYPQQKTKEIMDGVKRHIFDLSEDDDQGILNAKAKDYDEMMSQLKEKYADPECTREEKTQVLSVLPKSWPVQRIMDEFGVNRYTAAQVKDLVAEDGILCSPRSKAGHGLRAELVDTVVKFYEDDDISRVMPGQRDYVSVVTGGVRQVIQKRLLTMSLKETYLHFAETHKDINISFSSFAALRPKNCKLLSKSGSHNVCVCTIHENVNLMLNSLKKDRILCDRTIYMEQLLCDLQSRTDFCHLRTCMNCYDTSLSETKLLEILEEKQILEVSFEQWTTTDRCNIELKTLPSEDFSFFFTEKLDKLIYHDFIKNKQAEFLKTKKQTLEDGEVVVICDFFENYTFVLQDEVQSYHWNNSQCTIHPFVVYFNDNGTLNHLSFVVISDISKHDTVAVQLFSQNY
ncbi:uncharacterized protein LOC135707233 [Ochlerotatus camptorhynchus]|uniref:uncharacterized protein LOC135707233 n=1 Tax=Ochlerotatus camptorhynchus TaxID=644619 RepID=UPI0031D47FCA